MKRIAFYALHYGKDYLAWSIRSIQDAVDAIYILYSPNPSFGYQTSLKCPDTEEELKEQAHRWAKKPIIWHRGNWNGHSHHRDSIYSIAEADGVSQILIVDEDEIWDSETAIAALDDSAKQPARIVRARFVHFWRSFNWLNEDPACPERIVNMGQKDGEWYLSPQKHPVFHFGYAQAPGITRYKESIHSHKSEWRDGWFENKFLPWRPGCNMTDVHPVCLDFWTPKRTNEETAKMVKHLMGDHPYFGKDIIE